MGERGSRFYQDKLSLPVGTGAFIRLFEQVLTPSPLTLEP